VAIHFLYKYPTTVENWKSCSNDGESNGFYNKNVGNYPYKQYSFIQGGDGGMEYAMCTLMLGNERL
jgi:hypothetical protein